MSQEKAYKVEVRGARGLLPMDPNGQSDPYCLVGVADTQTNTFLDPSNVVRSKVIVVICCMFVFVVIFVLHAPINLLLSRLILLL